MQLLNTSILVVTSLTALCAQDRNVKLIWHDEFDGPANAVPDSSRWAYDIGATGWGNHELEEYTRDRRNAFLDGEGHLVIRAIRTEPDKYTSARLKTKG